MSSRTLIGLVIALVVLAGLAALGHRNVATTAAGAGHLFMPGLEDKLNQVDRVEVERAGNAPVATLLREKDRWVVQQKDKYPADIGKVRDTLLGLAQAHIVEEKTSNPEYYSRLGVEPVKLASAGGTQLTLRNGDQTLAAVTIGKESGNSYRYVRRNADAASYLVDKALDVPTDAAKWVDTSIVDLPSERVEDVTISRAGGETLHISKDKADQQNFTVEDVPKGRELQYPGVANVIGGALRELKLEDVAAADDTKPAEVTATYRTFDGLVVAVEGRQGNGGPWIEVEASVDPNRSPPARGSDAAAAAKAGKSADQTGAAEPPADGTAKAGADAAGKSASGAASKDAAGPDPKAEADGINARVHGWRYRIASYQYDQITRRMSDLLKAEEKKQDKKSQGKN